LLTTAPGYPLSAPVTAINGPQRTWAQLALHMSLICRTEDIVLLEIRSLEDWLNKNYYNNAGQEVDNTIPAHTQESINSALTGAQNSTHIPVQVVNVSTSTEYRQFSVPLSALHQEQVTTGTSNRLSSHDYQITRPVSIQEEQITIRASTQHEPVTTLASTQPEQAPIGLSGSIEHVHEPITTLASTQPEQAPIS